jgi:hypothetical protein
MLANPKAIGKYSLHSLWVSSGVKLGQGDNVPNKYAKS